MNDINRLRLNKLMLPSHSMKYRGHNVKITLPFVVPGTDGNTLAWQPWTAVTVDGEIAKLTEDDLRALRSHTLSVDVSPTSSDIPPLSQSTKDVLMAAINRHIDARRRWAS